MSLLQVNIETNESTVLQCISLFQLMYPIIRRSSSDVHKHLQEAEVGTIFALPWLITWFGHVLPVYSDVVRLYDFFIAGPPLMPVYLAAAIVLHREQEILDTGDHHKYFPLLY